MKRILVISTIPSTSGIGGVSIHTQRLMESKDLITGAYQLELFDYKNHTIKDYLRQISGCDVVHIHISNPKARLAFVILAKIRRKKVILTIHGNLGRHGRLNNLMDNISIRLANVPILLNQKSFEKALKINHKSEITPAFIPPQTFDPLPDGIVSILKRIDRNKYKKIFATNAYRQSYDEKGNEIYGIRFLINFFKNIRKDYFLIISDPSGEYSNVLENVNLPENIAIIKERHSFFELLKNCNGMIRATSTDGDALSVKEALSLGKNVIATDCVERPNGVILFRYNDEYSLSEAVKTANQHEGDLKVIESAIPYLKNIYLKI